MASREQIAIVVGMIAEAFDRRLSDAMLEAYLLGLADVTNAQLTQAATAALRSPVPFMPKPGELRALALTDGVGLEACADRAWLRFLEARSRVGASRGVNFCDALINGTVRLLGGWCQACWRPTEELHVWFRKDFYATYARLMTAPPPANQCLPMLGEQAGIVFVPCDYVPILESPRELAARPANLPRIEMKKAT